MQCIDRSYYRPRAAAWDRVRSSRALDLVHLVRGVRLITLNEEGASGTTWARTTDTHLFKMVLYLLSYRPSRDRPGSER